MKKRIHNKSTGRDYSYDRLYNKKTIEERSQRNKARREMFNYLKEKYGRKEAKRMMKNKDVDHKRAIKSGGSNSKRNLRLMSKSKNRARK